MRPKWRDAGEAARHPLLPQERSRSSSDGGTKKPPTTVRTFPCPFGDGGVIQVPYGSSHNDTPYGVIDAVIRLSNNCGEGSNYYVAGTNQNFYRDGFGHVFFHNDPSYYKEKNVPYISFDNLNYLSPIKRYTPYYTGQVIVKQYTIIFCRTTKVRYSAFCRPGREDFRSTLTVRWLPDPRP